MRVRSVALIATVALCLLGLDLSAGAEGRRFEGYVGGSLGPDHSFVVGDGFSLVFVDHRRSSTPYRVCWHQLHHAHHRCWSGETGARGRPDEIFTAAPSAVGTFIVKWTVAGRRKAMWRFHNGIGD